MASLVRVWISFGESAPPAVHELGEQPSTVGREPTCQIFVDDSSVSRNHASIALENGQYILRDHGSVNGTFVNGEAVRSHILKQGDTIRFGEMVYVFQEGEISPEMAQALQTPATPPLESTSAHPIQQVPVPRAQNKPVKVMIGAKAKPGATTAPLKPDYHMSRTIPISKNRASSLPSSGDENKNKTQRPDFSFISYVCGCAGALAFLPAIYYGHQANPVTPEEENHQNKGLLLGYVFLAFWSIGIAYFLIYGQALTKKHHEEAAPTVLDVPKIANGLKLLQGPLMWSPSRKQIQIFTEKAPADPREKRSFNQIYGEVIAQWEGGLVIYEPEILRTIPAFSEGDKLKFVIEDFLSKPNFLSFNSTVVPEKKDPLGHFYIPSLSSSMFFARDQNIRANVDRFNGDEFPWHNAYRGILWTGEPFDYNASQISQIRVFFILKAGSNPYTFKINTREGNLNSDYDQTYQLTYYPAEYLAEVVFLDKTSAILGIQTNPAAFASPQDELRAHSLLRANIIKILEMKTTDETSIPSTFRLGSVFQALQDFPLPAKKTPNP